MAEIIWTETALNDINNIAEYISLQSDFYAKQFVGNIFLASKKLENHPHIGKPVPELAAHHYREIFFKKYRIIHRIYSEIVYIISVHHSSRLLENNEIFRDLFE